MRTNAKALAALAVSALALTACAADETPPETSESATTAPITFTWGYEQEFGNYNNNTADSNALANAVVLNQVLPGFYYFAPDGTVTPNTDFGTYEKTADDPLTIKYTFNANAKWSDGEGLDCDDMVLTWLARSAVSQDPDKEGSGFSTSAATGYEQMKQPACADGDKTVTVVYNTPFADWATLFGTNEILPAHILEKESGVTDIIAAAAKPKDPALKPAYKFWNTGWNLNPGKLKPEIMPSSGPYTISAWQAQQSLTLTASDTWWGTKPKSKTIVIRYLGGDTQVQALQNGEVNAIDPQPQVELVNQLKAAGDKVKYETGDQFTFEHFDFNFVGPFKDKRLREAFAKCLPREQMVGNLIKPVNPDARIVQSRFVFPFQDSYAKFETSTGGEAYDKVDIAGAKALLEDAGKVGQVVRIGWRKDPEAINQRRVDQVALTKASCDQAGFKIKDSGTPDFFEVALPSGDYEVAMFAWTGSPTVTASNDIYRTKGGNNFGKYSNKDVDATLNELATTTDPDAQVDLMVKADTLMWTDLATIPVFTFPGLAATTPDAEGVVYNATQADLTWNAFAWSLKQ